MPRSQSKKKPMLYSHVPPNGPRPDIPGEPVAIIGMGCRFPGAPDPESLWRALCDRVDCIGDIPSDRFPELDSFYDPTPGMPGKVVTRQGGFLERIDGFDPSFFGISPREATFMDPQQRLLLEVGWEALEDAGLPIESLSRSRTGVFVGLWTSDYEVEMFRATSEIDLYMTTGGSRYAAAGRLSYAFDLQGPSLVADTACSTSLVTAHLACQSLRMGESDLALAGGVNLILQPPITVAFSKAKMLSPDGRCKFADAAANGYVRSEGCGMVVLKPLSKAIADGDRIYATILGSAVNSDGQEGFFVAPSQSGQEKMLREAYRAAGRSPGAVAYLEAHGTGTSVGDPTELNALGAVLGEGRPENEPCVIGSVKTNIGHCESAAGVAGLIKAALCLERRTIPPTLHLNNPNPGVPWADLPFKLATDARSLPARGAAALAGVNSFGISGTNAHLVLEEPPLAEVRARTASSNEGRAFLLPLSARSKDALAAMASSWVKFLRQQEFDDDALYDVCYTASVRRSHHHHRLAVAGNCSEDLLASLELAAQGDLATNPAPQGPVDGSAVPVTGPVFVFSGQGPQWWAMGRRLFETEPIYREMLERIDALASQVAGWSILRELNADESQSKLDNTEVAQPALFALQMGLDALWRSWGIEPGAIVGHSLGEVAAACASGVLSLEDAVRVVVHRGRLLQEATGLGKMAAAELTLTEAEEMVARHEGKVGIAAINSPSSVTLTGEAQALEKIIAQLAKQEKFCRMLPVNYAFHSAQVARFADMLRDEVAGIAAHEASVPLISTVTGRAAQRGENGADYWARNVRQRVEFASAINTLIDAGHNTFLELSPDPVLPYSIRQCFAHRGETVATLASIRRNTDECHTMLSSLGELYTRGYRIDWRGLYPTGGRCVSLPTYPWQRERFWFEPGIGSGIVGRADSAAAGVDDAGSNLGRAQHSAALPGHFFWEKLVAADSPAYLRDHIVEEAVTYPAAAFLEGALAAAHDVFGSGTHELVGMNFERALSFGENDCRALQTALTHEAPGTFACRFYSRDFGGDMQNDEWTLHAHGSIWIDGVDGARTRTRPSLEGLTQRSDATAYDHHADMSNRGLNYGPAFRAVEKAWRGDGWAAARLHVPAETDWSLGDYRANPGVWDAGFQLLVALVPRSDSSRHDVFLPVAINKVRRCSAFADAEGLWATATIRYIDMDVVEGDIDFLDAAGETIASVECLRLLRLERAGRGQVRDWFYEIQWQPVEIQTSPEVLEDGPESLPMPKIAVMSIGENVVAKKRTDDLCREGLRAAEFNPELDRLCSAYAQQGFRTLGWNLGPGETATDAELASSLGIVETQRQMFGRVLELLAEDGVLERDGDSWRALENLVEVSASEIWEDLSARFPEFSAELDFLGNCGDALASVLKGELDPLVLLFSEESAPALEHLYQDAPMLRGPNELAEQTIVEIVAAWPEDKPIRVCEIGAGTGGTTKRILSVLPAERTEYVFTDLSHYFLEKAKKKFLRFPFLDPRIFDVEKEPAEQGIRPGSFDIVLASNVLHATADLRATLRNARRLLAPNGILLLVEGNQPTRMVDMIFGLTEGWWKFDDRDLRPSHPLLSTDSWDRVLAETGFDESTSVTAAEVFGSAVFPQAVIVARASDQPQLPQQRDWLIFADAGGTGTALAQALRAQGANCRIVMPGDGFFQDVDSTWRIDPACEEHFERVINQALPGDSVSPTVIHLWALDAPSEFAYSGDDAEDVQSRICGSALYIAKALAGNEHRTPPLLWFATRGAQPVDGSTQALAPSQATLWGLAKVIALEHPELGCQLVDLDPSEDIVDSVELARILTSTTGQRAERWLARRGQQLFGARLARPETARSRATERLEVPVNRAYELQITARGALDNVLLAPVGRRALVPGEVEMRVLATGQNFRDIYNLLGMGAVLRMGLECSGIVTAVGDGVDELRVGDPVMALAMGSFASYATAPVQMVARKPAYLSHEQAAAVPVAFLTVHFALRELAHIKSGDRVLIHAASGGVGMAAIQIAKSAGATIFGTAGSPAKRATLKAMGVHHVMDSRSLAFADQIHEITEGRGVDIVLNCLAGDFIRKSFEALSEKGSFVEIGKSGVWNEAQARALKKHCNYHILDLPTVMQERPDDVAAAFQALLNEFDAGVLTPAPIQTFPIEDIVTAFRTMSQAKHIGKIVITQNDLRVDKDLPTSCDFRANGTYLVTGGFGGLGLLVAQWLVDRGARHLVLTSRSAPSAEANVVIADLRKCGATVTTPLADVSIGADVARLLSEISQSHPPISGVIHSAGVLEDGVLMQQTWDRTWKVLAPKVAGAMHLHSMTRDMPLEMFVLFSSWCSVLGSAGQANHSAANAFLDTLAHYRRAEGLPALSINWGAWTEIGAAARVDRSDNLARQGIGSFTPSQGIGALECLIAENATQAAVVPFNLDLWRHVDRLGDKSHLFDRLAEESEAQVAETDGAQVKIRAALAAASTGTQRQEIMEDHVRFQVAQVLRLQAGRVDRRKPFKELGLDSLTGLELRNRLESSLDLSLPGTLIWNYPSVDKLAHYLTERLGAPLESDSDVQDQDTATAGSLGPLEGLLDELESLSDEEAAILLKSSSKECDANE